MDPDASHLASNLVLLMQLKAAPFRNIVEVRTAMEPMISSLAAERMDDVALTDLEGTIIQMREEIEDQHSFLDANKRFHDIIAWSSGNALFGYIIDSLSGIMDGTAIGIDYPSHRRQAILKAHIEIFDALKARDPKESEARMREHIDAYERYAARKFPQVLKETIPWEQRYFA
jgi:DNA-binding FadR family transcriptional regulator